MAAKFQLYPYQASYNNWIQVWDAGNAFTATSGVPTNPGYLGTIYPSDLTNLTGTGISFTKKLGWPTYLPFNQSRTLYLSSNDDSWSDNASIFFTYQNYWGFYITETLDALSWNNTGTLLGDARTQIGVPTDTNFMACRKFFYPNRLIDFTISYVGAAPTSPLYIDLGNIGMAEFQIQDSVRYGNSNFALEVLTDNPGTSPDFETQYTVLGSNYPRFVFDNNQYANPMGPMTVSNFFLPYDSVTNAFENAQPTASTITSSVYWLATEDFVINGPLNENSFNNLPFDGGLLNVLVDIGNQRRNEGYTTEDPGSDNQDNLLLSLIQNGITN